MQLLLGAVHAFHLFCLNLMGASKYGLVIFNGNIKLGKLLQTLFVNSVFHLQRLVESGP